MNYRQLAIAIGLCGAAAASHAGKYDFPELRLITQQDFRLLSEDLGAAFSYKPITPAEPLGILGFDVGVEVTATQLANPEAFRRATGASEDTLYVPRLHVAKGLPFGFDVGASYTALPGGEVSLFGAEARYALVPGNVVMPAVAVRASYSTLRGADRLELNTRGLDVSVSKGFAMFTPYAGVGVVRVDSDPRDTLTLRREKFDQNKVFVGANVNLMVMNLAVEADRTGETTSYSAKLGWRW
ncbi:hypothetical protein [Caldimonas tepidiphila]|uniref:hypothetical protein n=1 Tax=Caldimonas tepidiphila TaxID=2315841 RepID=UPI000E5B0F4F|nr:hypothetical protein [Caldimonas tepidiphila]